jgi:hypothetical protein
VPTITLTERLDQARREAGDLRDQLAVADSELNEALERRDYAAAEGLKLAADALRQPLYISAATVTALEAAVKQLADHEAEQQRAAFERDRRDQAAAQHLQAREREPRRTCPGSSLRCLRRGVRWRTRCSLRSTPSSVSPRPAVTPTPPASSPATSTPGCRYRSAPIAPRPGSRATGASSRSSATRD